MEFIETLLSGAYRLRLKRIEDQRGYFARGWCCEELVQHGLTGRMVQLNVGFSRQRGTLRGMHYQEAPHAEAKLVRCTRGAVFDVMIDLREGSPTRGKWFGVELTPENGEMLYVPEGFAHGYQTLIDGSEIYYLTSVAYVPSVARGVRYDDVAFGIQWPLPVSAISDPDRQWPDFRL
jgi:dTDP-4-dehydrorhamnose 3,5-epimerase